MAVKRPFWIRFVGPLGLAVVGAIILLLVASHSAFAAPPSLPGKDVAAVVTTAPGIVASAHNRTVLNVRNNGDPNAGVTIACRLGATPGVHAAGSHDIFAGYEWSACADGFCSSDALTCVAASGSVNATVLDY